MKKSLYFGYLKRPLDLGMASAGLVLLSPAMLVVGLLIAIFMGRPVFFRQRRAGLGGHVFEVLKFRTMAESCNSRGELLPDEERITPLGSFLRRYSLDELPQLLNVVKGDMSIVGPRPLISRYLPRYSKFQSRRHEVRPGITGWAQVRGRNALDWPLRFELDVWYVDHVSLALDLWIILATVGKIWHTADTTPDKQEAMPEFLGNMEEEVHDGHKC